MTLGHLLAAALMVAPASPPPTFDSLIEQARVAFEESRHEAAAAALEAAYAVSPVPDVLFNWANAERLAGHCDEALALYDRYLEATADAQDDELSARYRSVASERREECEDASAPEPTAAVVPAPAGGDAAADTPVDDTAAPDDPPAPDEAEGPRRLTTPRVDPDTAAARDDHSAGPRGVRDDERTRRRPDPLGWSLVALGAASLTTSGVLLGVGYSREASALDEPSHASYRERIDDAARLTTGGWVMLGVGTAATVVGVIRLVVRARRHTRPMARLGRRGIRRK